ncbi:hypothetical protein CK203_007315 [Vitis vinifera]|uniref:Uncharacterized protein n=1 Tax=Vitis vinifera TaxID=29760 RepID=A0A438G1N4_VITVI|nr:hypothetical protein CK203_007315 [Vitis vinifera]
MAPKAEKKPAEKKPAEEKKTVAEKSPAEKKPKAGHGDHEQLHQRHLREACSGGIAAGALQQEADDHFSGDPDGRPIGASRRVGQARRFRGHQGRNEVHQFLKPSIASIDQL